MIVARRALGSLYADSRARSQQALERSVRGGRWISAAGLPIRPRGVAKAAETSDDWWPDLGPSRELLAAFHGKTGPALAWDAYVPR